MREGAIKAFVAFLARCDTAHRLRALHLAMQRLRACDAASQREADAFAAQGLLGLCVLLVKAAPAAHLLARWPQALGTFEPFLAHAASTVRQAASEVFLHLATKSADGAAEPMVRPCVRS